MHEPSAPRRPRKWTNVALLAVAELLAMSLWFSASAVVPQLRVEWSLDAGQAAWTTMAVQLGFVIGAAVMALSGVADRVPARTLFATSAVAASVFNGAIAIGPGGPSVAITLRFLTGACLAGVYPPGMKLVATWCDRDRGLGIGILVGALTIGSASPHLINGLPIWGGDGMPPWREVLLASSLAGLLAGAVVAFAVRQGPLLARTSPASWRDVAAVFKSRPLRLANLGYLGHMWELYAMWTWVPLFLLEAYEAAGWSLSAGRIAGFAVVAIGGPGCILAGIAGDRWGRTNTVILSLVVSGGCALVAGALFDRPFVLTVVCALWGLAVVADSAQFSVAVTELADRRFVGTALTVQTALGFLLTLVTIRLAPTLAESSGWTVVFIVLALGPVVGILSMLHLRALPEAIQMADGRR